MWSGVLHCKCSSLWFFIVCSFFWGGSGFEGFTDYRCFHVTKKAVSHNGVTKEVGIVECKPDAATGSWGDTSGTPGRKFFEWHPHQYKNIEIKMFSACRNFPPSNARSPQASQLWNLVEQILREYQTLQNSSPFARHCQQIEHPIGCVFRQNMENKAIWRGNQNNSAAQGTHQLP